MATKKSPSNDTPTAPVEAPDHTDTDGNDAALGTAETPASAGSMVEEKATVLRRLGERSARRSDMLQADFESKASALEETAEVLRSMLSREAA